MEFLLKIFLRLLSFIPFNFQMFLGKLLGKLLYKALKNRQQNDKEEQQINVQGRKNNRDGTDNMCCHSHRQGASRTVVATSLCSFDPRPSTQPHCGNPSIYLSLADLSISISIDGLL